MATAYEALRQQYHDTARAATGGDAKAKGDKSKMMNDLRAMEREAAREGTILIPTLDARGKVNVKTESAPSKRSLHEEYVRKFDGETQVRINDKPTTLREYHSKRLLGR